MLWQFALNVAVVVVSALFYRPPSGPSVNVARDIPTPKSVEGAPIYDGAGTFWVEDAHVVWSGDFDTKKIRGKGGKK